MRGVVTVEFFVALGLSITIISLFLVQTNLFTSGLELKEGELIEQRFKTDSEIYDLELVALGNNQRNQWLNETGGYDDAYHRPHDYRE